MSTQAQLLANRENAQHSTGPRSAEGKSRSAANSTRHGLSGCFAVLNHESLEEFLQLQADYQEQFQPENAHERFLVTQMVQAQWRLARIDSLESRAFEIFHDYRYCKTDPGAPTDDEARIFHNMDHGAPYFDHLHRYRTAAERSYYRAHKELMDGRSRQIKDTLD